MTNPNSPPTSTHCEEEVYDVPPTTPSAQTDPPQLKFSMAFPFCEFAQFQISNSHPLTESHLQLMEYFRGTTAEVTLTCDVPQSPEKRDKLDQLLNDLESGSNSSHPLQISMSLPINQLAEVPPPLPERDYCLHDEKSENGDHSEVESEEDVESEESEESEDEDKFVSDLRDIERLSNQLTSNQKGKLVYLAVSGAEVFFQSEEFGDQKGTLYFDCSKKKTQAKLLDFKLKVPMKGERPLIEFEGKTYRPIESLDRIEEGASGGEESNECVVSESIKDGEASSEVITLEQLIGDQEGSKLMHGNMTLFNKNPKALSKRKPKRFNHTLDPSQNRLLFYLLPFMTTEMLLTPEPRWDTGPCLRRFINGHKEENAVAIPGHASSSQFTTVSENLIPLEESEETSNYWSNDEDGKALKTWTIL